MTPMHVRTINETVAANVRAEMARRQHSQNSLATLIGMRQQALSRRLSGQKAFTVDEIAAIASVLGCPVTDLLVAA